jgi:Phage integrase, N-terminal SAM-like domain
MAGHDGIYQRGRTSWRIVVSAGRDPLTAKYATVRETIRGTKTDAKKRLIELRAEVQRGTVAKGGTETAAAYLPRYIEHRIAIGKVRPRTANTYRTHVARWVVPRIGSLRLSQVRAVHVQRVLDEALSAGLSARSVLQVHRILHGAFPSGRAVEPHGSEPLGWGDTTGSQAPQAHDAEARPGGEVDRRCRREPPCATVGGGRYPDAPR